MSDVSKAWLSDDRVIVKNKTNQPSVVEVFYEGDCTALVIDSA